MVPLQALEGSGESIFCRVKNTASRTRLVSSNFTEGAIGSLLRECQFIVSYGQDNRSDNFYYTVTRNQLCKAKYRTIADPSEVLFGTNAGYLKIRRNWAYTRRLKVLRMMGCTDQWLQLTEIAKLFGLSEDSIKRRGKIMVYLFAE